MATGLASVLDEHRATGPPASPTRRELRGTECALIGLEAFISLCGLAGGAYLMLSPHSAMPTSELQGTFFHSWFWPGVALAFFVGLCPLAVAFGAKYQLRAARIGHIVVGTGLVAWILLEMTWVVVSPVLQTLVAAVGISILVLGIHEFRHQGRSNNGLTE